MIIIIMMIIVILILLIMIKNNNNINNNIDNDDNTSDLRTKIMDLRGFDSSRIIISSQVAIYIYIYI